MNRKEKPLQIKDTSPQTNVSVQKIKSVKNAKAGLEVMFEITDFDSMEKDFTLCFCRLIKYEKTVDEAIAYAQEQYNYETWPQIFQPPNTPEPFSKERFVPIVSSYHILLVLLQYAQQLKAILKEDKIFSRKSSAESEQAKKELLAKIKELLEPIHIPWMLLAIDDWIHLIVPESYYMKAMQHLISVSDARPNKIPTPKGRKIRDTLFTLNTLLSLRLFTEACWKGLVTPGKKNRPAKNQTL